MAVTGLGAVTPLGIGAEQLHERWAAGEVGIVDGAGACTDFEPKERLSVKQIRRLDRFSQIALVAADEAIEQAGWSDGLPYDPMRIGCVIATGIGGIETVESQHDVMRDRGAKMVSPLGIPQYMPNAAAAALSMTYGLQGQMYGVVSACSSGAHAIGSAMRMIQYGDADRGDRRRLRGDADRVRVRLLSLDAGAVSDRHVAPVRRAARRLRDGRGRGHDRARGARGGQAPRARRSSARWSGTARLPTPTT